MSFQSASATKPEAQVGGLKLCLVRPSAELRPVFPDFLQAWLAEAQGRLPACSDQARRQSGMYEAQNAPPRSNNHAADRKA